MVVDLFCCVMHCIPKLLYNMWKIFDRQSCNGGIDFSGLVELLCDDDSHYFSVCQTRRYSYFSALVKRCGVCCAIIEEEYVDRDYIHDYSSYYSLCFSKYSKCCKRCHLFSKKYSKEEIYDIILKGGSSSIKGLRDSYIGFFVFKPLPKVSFGRTYIKADAVCAADSKQIHFFAKVKAEVCFFGLNMSVEGIPFQEQDSIVAVCATSALWTAFQITQYKFRHTTYSPCLITRMATPDVVFPNRGLFVKEMIHAISSIGLGTYHEFALDEAKGVPYPLVKAVVAAYLPIGVPIILIGSLGIGEERLGLHAVTVCGCRFVKKPSLKKHKGAITLFSDGMESLICSDDQVGPYCEMTPIFCEEEEENDNGSRWRTQWLPKYADSSESMMFSVTNILVPLYPKIRVSYDQVKDVAETFIRHIHFACEKGTADILRMAQWHFKLVECDIYKEFVRTATHFTPSSQKAILFKSCPKYMWEVSAMLTKVPLLTFILDATDIAHDIHVVFAIRKGDWFDYIIKVYEHEKEFLMHPFTRAYCKGCFEYV